MILSTHCYARLNSSSMQRTITAVSSFHKDIEALTPNHFLLERMLTSMPPETNSQRISTDKRFWERLLLEFIPILLPRQKWTLKTSHTSDGQTVWILKDLTSRRLWPLGRIDLPILSTDQVIRQNNVGTRRGKVKNQYYASLLFVPSSTDNNSHPKTAIKLEYFLQCRHPERFVQRSHQVLLSQTNLDIHQRRNPNAANTFCISATTYA